MLWERGIFSISTPPSSARVGVLGPAEGVNEAQRGGKITSVFLNDVWKWSNEHVMDTIW